MAVKWMLSSPTLLLSTCYFCRSPAAADPQVGRGADLCWTETGRGAGEGLQVHVPRGWGGVCLSARVWVPQTPQHLPSRPEGVRLWWGQGADDSRCIHQGTLLDIQFLANVPNTFQFLVFSTLLASILIILYLLAVVRITHCSHVFHGYEVMYFSMRKSFLLCRHKLFKYMYF